MAVKVAALYRFAPLPDCADLVAPLRELCAELGIRGTLLLAPEGINGTVAGTDEAIDDLVAKLSGGWVFGNRLAGMELKFSTASALPFGRLKVRVKREIVAFDGGATDPSQRVGTYVAPADWNALIADSETVVIDTRNAFEVAIGTFVGARDPGTVSFGQFRDYVARELDPARHRRIALFCTGGIRCEKASAYLIDQGFAEVHHLKGGILAYLEQVPERESLWRGGCFVFDGRVALGHGLAEAPETAEGIELA
ncbi:rhodanese-related sulfurtransferase [Phreatobacter sp.]|uniref:oxygen-dependent tRNA uridine(34) hydroxylase TrhO n=1 Tax=Phreatobacter sp. TaxID=1966341 RepID=UPI0026015DA0|nr:rhodanese-related sulfurtransferase [Phreatobacter sp.]